MKFLMMTGLMVAIFFSCNNDDDDTASPAAPTFSSPPADVSVEVGEAEDVTYSVNTPGRYTTATVASSDDAVATATVKTQAAPNSTTGSVVVTVTGVAAGSATITLTVNDGEGQRATDELGVTVEEEDTETPDGPANAADSLGNIENLSTLSAAIEAAGLDDDLNGDGPFTIFAPNNAAFVALLESFDLEDDDLDGLIDALTEEGLAGVLRAHVVADSLGATEVTAAVDGEALETLNDDATITVTQVGDSLFVNGAGILRANIEVGNGVIHVIDSVINTDIETDGGEGESTIDADQAPRESLEAYLGSEFTGNVIVDPALGGVASTAGGLNPVPSAAEVTSNVAPYPDGDFFTSVNYKGAFDPASSATWLDGWTLLSRSGYLAGSTAQDNGAAYDPTTATIVDVQSPITEDVNWTADNVYRISGYTFVNSGTLTIEPGTVVIATPQEGEQGEASALIITTGAMIDAEGTAENPIIFTSSLDDGQLLPTDAGQWGGLVVLGTAPAQAGPATSDIQIEGIESDAGNSTYGGQDAADNSGTLKYISIRHTGDILGNGNEVQGLTLGGVGSGTTIDYIESIGSADDGVEIFGGTVNIKHFAVAYQEDDAFDFDQGWVGNGQFLFSLAIPGSAGADDSQSDHAGEWDGFDEGNPETALTSDFTIYNATFVGAGQESSRSDEKPAILVRENAAVTLANSIITNYNGKAIDVQNLSDTDTGDSFARFANGDIDLLGNIYFVNPAYTDFSSGDTGIVAVSEED